MTTTTTSSNNSTTFYTDRTVTGLAYEWANGDQGAVSFGHLDIPKYAVATITIFEEVRYRNGRIGQREYTTTARMMGHGSRLVGFDRLPATYWVKVHPDDL